MACKDCHLISPGRTGGELAPAPPRGDRLLWLQRAQPSATLDKIPHQVVVGHLRGDRSRDQRNFSAEPEKMLQPAKICRLRKRCPPIPFPLHSHPVAFHLTQIPSAKRLVPRSPCLSFRGGDSCHPRRTRIRCDSTASRSSIQSPCLLRLPLAFISREREDAHRHFV